MALTAQQTVVKQLLDELKVIAEQNKIGKQGSDEDRVTKRSLKLMAKTLTEKTEYLTTKQIDAEVLAETIEDLEAWSELVLPTAEVTWDHKEAEAKILVLTGMGNLGLLTEQDQQDLDAIKEGLKVGRSNGGGTAQEPIEGRPAKVTISYEGKVISTQRGDTTTSVGNIKTRVVAFVKQGNPELETVPEAVQEGILGAARLVCTAEATKAEFGGFTFEAVAA